MRTLTDASAKSKGDGVGAGLPTWTRKEMRAFQGKGSSITVQAACFLLFQSLAKLTDGFKNSFSLSDPLQEFPHNPGALGDSLPQQFCDAGSQTDIIGEVRPPGGGRALGARDERAAFARCCSSALIVHFLFKHILALVP